MNSLCRAGRGASSSHLLRTEDCTVRPYSYAGSGHAFSPPCVFLQQNLWMYWKPWLCTETRRGWLKDLASAPRGFHRVTEHLGWASPAFSVSPHGSSFQVSQNGKAGEGGSSWKGKSPCLSYLFPLPLPTQMDIFLRTFLCCSL